MQSGARRLPRRRTLYIAAQVLPATVSCAADFFKTKNPATLRRWVHFFEEIISFWAKNSLFLLFSLVEKDNVYYRKLRNTAAFL
ncbi:MAG: hypothetical protein PHP45_05970 [Elusimicrobiales bacterium]|nr:hypothetical protein [Elusimicrobiales bacterium]